MAVFQGDVDFNEIELMIDFLLIDGMILKENVPNKIMEFHYSVSFKGKLFIENEGYVEKAKRMKIDYELREKQLRKTSWDVRYMKITFLLALLGITMSFINLVISIIKK